MKNYAWGTKEDFEQKLGIANLKYWLITNGILASMENLSGIDFVENIEKYAFIIERAKEEIDYCKANYDKAISKEESEECKNV